LKVRGEKCTLAYNTLNDHGRVLLEHGNALECVDPKLMNEYHEDEVLPVLK